MKLEMMLTNFKQSQIINQLTQELVNEQEKRIIVENNLNQEKQINHNLRQQLQSTQKINTNLTQEKHIYEQNYSNLQNAYQITLKEKQIAEKQLNQLIQEIKTAAQQFYQ